MTKKIKTILLSLVCILSICATTLAPIPVSAHSIPVKVRLTGSGFKTVYASGTTNYYRVNTDILNVRMTPSTKYSPIKKLSRGTKVKVVSRSGNWVEIETIHKHGSHYATKGFYAETGRMWVHKDYIKKATNTIHLINLRAYQYSCVH